MPTRNRIREHMADVKFPRASWDAMVLQEAVVGLIMEVEKLNSGSKDRIIDHIERIGHIAEDRGDQAGSEAVAGFLARLEDSSPS